MRLSGWGRFPVHEARVSMPRSEAALAERVAEGRLIARGNGRAYGDSAVSRTNTVDMRHFNRMLAFDPKTGQLVAEAGVLLSDIITTFLPKGWFPAVTPGTKYVTLGGAIAADVHGKNHHRDGSFSAFVDWIDIMVADGSVRRCSRLEESVLFGWTVGGMGLTGVILRAAIRLRPVETGWIRQTTIPARNLDMALAALDAGHTATYSVAWIDCLGTGERLGRALVMLGDHAAREELPPSRQSRPFEIGRRPTFGMPIDAPHGLLNGITVRTFNSLYYWAGSRKQGTHLVDWDSYFYPLDKVLGWNRIYGRKGFLQFQCVLPLHRSKEGLTKLLEATSTAGQGSFLAVLKRFGKQESAFSFPMEGHTLALDFPVSGKTLALVERLDRITLDHGGRFYLAKDARMSAETQRAADERTAQFTEMRRGGGRAAAFRSEQSERLGL